MITAVVVGILLAIIFVGVMNVLWMTIRERRAREVGALRAIGMGRGKGRYRLPLFAPGK